MRTQHIPQDLWGNNVTGIGVSINYSAISAVAENVQGFPQGKPRGQYATRFRARFD
jgi:hypothetical protein